MTLTTLERKVFEALRANAEEVAGGDFGIVGEIKYRKLGLTAQAFGALLTTLGEKGLVTVHEPIETNGGPKRGGERHRQFTLDGFTVGDRVFLTAAEALAYADGYHAASGVVLGVEALRHG